MNENSYSPGPTIQDYIKELRKEDPLFPDEMIDFEFKDVQEKFEVDICDTCVHDLLKNLVEAQTDFVSLEFYEEKLLGFFSLKGKKYFGTSLEVIRKPWGEGYSNPKWGHETMFRDLIKSPVTRRKIAFMISTGDHCLEFMD